MLLVGRDHVAAQQIDGAFIVLIAGDAHGPARLFQDRLVPAQQSLELGRSALGVARRLGFERFRSGQEAAIRAVLEGRDVLAVLPTGGGKSAIYQVAARC